METHMRFYTEQESSDWLNRAERKLPDKSTCSIFTASYPKEAYRYYYIAHWIANSLTYREPALLLITEWGIWPSSENWHLYYKLRQSYGDQRFLHEAPGHLFLNYETEDLATFLQIAMSNGWGGYVLTAQNYVNLFFSHDEWIDYYADREPNLAEVRAIYEQESYKPA
jgi:hypothetical protein